MAVKRLYFATALTGGTEGALDNYDGANLRDLDAAVVVISNKVYFYSLDDDSGLAESSPDVISPDANAGDKRWILVSVYEGVVSDHGSLSGLDDPEDHTWALLTDGSRSLTSDWDAGSHKITAETLESDIVTGTAPLTVASTTVVANLNADKVDGKDESDLLLTDGSNALTGNLSVDAGITIDDVDISDHNARHESGGADAIKLDDLDSPEDNADLNATISAHGLCPKGDNNTDNFLRGDMTWNAPPASPPGGSDTHVQFNDGGSAFGGDSDLTWDKTANELTINGSSLKLTSLTQSAINLYSQSFAGTKRCLIKLWTWTGGPTYYFAGEIYSNGNNSNFYINSNGDFVLQRSGSNKIEIKNASIDVSDEIHMDTNEKIQFRDSAIHIQSANDGHLDLTADTSIDLNGEVIGSAGVNSYGNRDNLRYAFMMG